MKLSKQNYSWFILVQNGYKPRQYFQTLWTLYTSKTFIATEFKGKHSLEFTQQISKPRYFRKTGIRRSIKVLYLQLEHVVSYEQIHKYNPICF